jgi:hypothetical protein
MRLWAEERRQATFEMLMTLPVTEWQVALGKYLASLTFLALMLGCTAAFPVMLSEMGTPDWGPVWGGYLGCLMLGAALLAIGMFVSGLTDNQALAFFLALLACLTVVGLGEIRPLIGDLARESRVIKLGDESGASVVLVHALTVPFVAVGLIAAVVGRDRAVGLLTLLAGVALNMVAFLAGEKVEANTVYARIRDQAADGILAAVNQINVLEHFREIERGVLSTNAMLLFASLIVFFVVLNVMSLESRRYG